VSAEGSTAAEEATPEEEVTDEHDSSDTGKWRKKWMHVMNSEA